MDLLTPRTVPFIFLVIAAFYLGTFVRHRQDEAGAIAQRNRLRMATIFGLVGGGLLLWRLVG